MRETHHQPLGVTLDQLDPSGLTPDDVDNLRTLLARHGVIVLPDQHLDDPAFLGFLSGFGDFAFTAGEQPLPGYPDLNLISNVGRERPPRSTFHVDTSYVRSPPAYTALRAVEIPRSGGQTLFSNQYRAFDTLPETTRTRLAGRTVRHVVTGVDLGPGEEAEADHLLFRPHPRTGRVALYLSTPQRCGSISGLDEAESRETIETLYRHSIHADNVYRHTWAGGDVVMWDNGCVMHKADHVGMSGARVLHRGMVARYV